MVSTLFKLYEICLFLPNSLFKFFFKVLHRNSAGIWQTYLIDVKFDICDKGQLESTNPIMKRAIAFFRQYDSTIGQGCPMNVRVFSCYHKNISTSTFRVMLTIPTQSWMRKRRRYFHQSSQVCCVYRNSVLLEIHFNFIAGTFMFHDGLYHPVTNQTFIELKLYAEIKANTRRTAMDLSMLNMG